MSVDTKLLRIPLYSATSLEHLESFERLAPSDLELLRTACSPDELRGLVAALRFAQANPQFDFRPFARPELAASNAQIHAFLCKVLKAMPALPDPTTR